jgi:2-oxoglutarate dehydrogenase E1 component
MLKEVGTRISSFPDDFNAHRQIRKVFDARVQLLESPQSLVDWGMAEALAFGTLVAEGNHVRMSGQVCNYTQRSEMSVVWAINRRDCCDSRCPLVDLRRSIVTQRSLQRCGT